MSAQLQDEARNGTPRTELGLGFSTEITPLLGNIQYPRLNLSLTVGRTTVAPSPVAGALAVQTHFWKWRAVYLCGLFAFMVSFASFLTEGPRMGMLQYAAFRECRAHHPWDHQGDPCKDVSWRVGEVRRYLGMLENILGLALAVPYGILADATSRKLVLALGLVGLVLRDCFFFNFLYYCETFPGFPIQIVYLAPLSVVIGGGPIGLSATVLSTMAYASPEEHRTQSFLYLSVAILLSEMLSRPVGSFLLDPLDLYTASVVGLPILSLASLVIPFIPSRQSRSTHSQSAADRSTTPQDPRSLGARWWQKVENVPTIIRNDVGPVLRDSALAIGLIALVLQRLARQFLDMMLKIGGVKLYWPPSDVGFIPSIAAIPVRRSQRMTDKQKSELDFIESVQAVVQIALFLLILPRVYRGLLQKWNNHPGRANLALGRLSVSFLAIGSLSMGMDLSVLTTVIIYTCGTGFSIAMRLFLTSLVRGHHITTLFTTMALIEGVAALLVGLTLDSRGWIDGLHIGLAFLVAAALYAVAGIMVWNMHAKIDDQSITEEDGLRSDSDGMDHDGDGAQCPPAYSP